jgi:hypothetical protein
MKKKKKEITYRRPIYVSLNYDTVNTIKQEDEENYNNLDSDDINSNTVFLEGKKDTTNKLKIKVIKIFIFKK